MQTLPMLKQLIVHWRAVLVTLTSALVLSGCGSGAVGGGSGSTPPAAVPTITLTLTETNGTGTRTSISAGNPARVNATFRTGAGAAIANTSLTFTTTSTLGTITPSTGTVLTDSNGVASVTLSSSTDSGAGVVTVTGQTTLSGATTPTTVTGTINYTAVGGPAPRPTISVVLTETNGTGTRTSISPGNPARVAATFRTGAGVAIPNAILTFSTNGTLGTFTPSTGTAITDANGVASVTLNSSTGSGAGVVTVSGQTTVPGETTPTTVESTINYNATGGPPPSPTIVVAFVDPTTGAPRTSVTPAAPVRVTATFRTASNAPIPGTVITFSVNDAQYGVLDPATGTALTDANGVASVILRASTASGAGTVTARGQTIPTGGTTAQQYSGDASFSVIGSPAGAATMSLTLTDPTTGATRSSISPTSPARLNATFRSSTGAPISGAVITFTTNDNTLARFDPAVGTALTDANGIASILLIASTASGAGTVTAVGQTAAAGSTTTGPVSAQISYSATGSSAVQPTLTLALTEPTSNAVRTSVAPGNPARVVATLRTTTGAPIPGVILTFTTDTGFGTFLPSTGTALTNANGVAEITLQSATTSGAATVRATGTATIPGSSVAVPVSGSVAYTATGGTTAQPTLEVTIVEPKAGAALAANATLFAKASAIVKDTMSALVAKFSPKFRTIVPGAPAQVNATFKSGSGAPIVGAVITFATDRAFGTITPTSGTALTDANGVASVQLSSSTTAGAATITATGQTTAPGTNTLTTYTGSATYTSTGASSNLPTLTVTLVDPVTNQPKSAITGTSPGKVVATFKNGSGAPLPGVVVTFATDAAYGSLDPASGTALTDANGVATVNLFASTTTGAATVTAQAQTTVPGSTAPQVFAGSTSFSTTAVPASLATMVVTLVDPTTGATRTAVGPDNPARLVATLRTGGGAPIVGAVVTFAFDNTLTLGAFLPTNGTALSDASGTATALLYPSTVSGAGRVTATTQLILPGNTAATTISGAVSFATTAPAVLGLTLNDPATGATRTSISSGNPARVTATVRQTSGAPAVGAVVSFTTDATLGTFNPSSGTALTDASGVASILLNAASLTAAGAARVTAQAQIGSGTTTTLASSTLGYSVGAANVSMSAVTIDTPALSAFGTTGLRVTVLAGGVPVSTPLTVSFTSPCASAGRAALTSSVSTSNGIASATYRDIGCAGADVVTATVTGLAISTTGSLVVAAPAVGSIQFVAASPTTIALKGTGGAGRQETSQVSFRVVDVGGNPLGGQTVNFALNTSVGGLSLSTNSAISDPSTGLVVATVQAGTVSTPIRVTASTVAGTQSLSTQSDQLTVSTGVPSQDGFSLSVSTSNIEGLDSDGATTQLTARLADHFKNPVPDGTVVNFTANGGSIGSSCATVNGRCSVALTSQASRPSNGRVAVLAYAIGEEAFIDKNGNGVYDAGEAFDMVNPYDGSLTKSTELPQAWVDVNENGKYDAGEPFINFRQLASGAYGPADAKFNGVSCTPSSGLCGDERSLHVYGQSVVVLSGGTATFPGAPASVDLTPTCQNGAAAPAYSPAVKEVQFTIVDRNNNVLPAGTTVTFATTNGTIVSSPTSFVVPNSTCGAAGVACTGTSNGATTFSITLRADATQATITDTVTGAITGRTCTNASPTGVLTVTVTTPSGKVSTRTVTVTD